MIGNENISFDMLNVFIKVSETKCSYTENPDYFISRVESEIIKYRSFLLCQQENTHLNLNHLLLP
ncbi:hypothetical protein, partial [Leuconostoc gasicomitatum]|uniref:hypothetical protein n=1 Tax=Leuconostoc gasicomitatum TaxID=115778 RepID=UPI0039ECC08C